MTRICHVTSAHKNNDIRIFQKECKSLAKQEDFDVHLVAQGESRIEDDVTVHGLGTSSKGRLNRIFSMSNKIYKKAASLKADIYHLHDPELLLYAKRLKKKNNIVIFDSHENYPQQIMEKGYIPFFLRRLIAFLYKTYETYVVKKIDAVIIPCTTFGKNPFSGRCKHSILLDNYPILDGRRKYIERSEIQNISCPKVCYVGGLTAARGITNLVKACDQANVKLILAGSFSSESYQTEVMQMKEARCVDYRGFCDYNQVTAIYEEADIGASILLKVGQYATMENLPTKTYEYLQVGLPVIMSDTDYNKKLMQKEDFAYLVDPGNVNEISDKIKSMLQNYKSTVRKTKLGNELVQSKYNWEVDFKKLLNLYKMLLKKRKDEEGNL